MNSKGVHQSMGDENSCVDSDGLTSRRGIGRTYSRSCRYQASETEGDTGCDSDLAE